MFGRRRTLTTTQDPDLPGRRVDDGDPHAVRPDAGDLDAPPGRGRRGEVAGEFEESKTTWVFPGTPRTGPLQPEMVFERGYWNTFYTLRFRPVDTVTVTIG
jgi:hypothetical protein